MRAATVGQTVAILGPGRGSEGGVGATVRAIADSRLNESYELLVVPTYREGGKAAKIWQSVHGLAVLTVLLVRHRVDLVHLHSSSGPSFTRKALALALARAARCPVVFHVHGGAFKAVLASNGRRYRLRRLALHWALEQADAVVALTPGWAADGAAGADIRSLHVVPNAPELARVPERRSLQGDSQTILFLGHLYREKGVFELLDAFTQLVAERPDLRLVMAGKGSCARALRAHVREAGLEDAVDLPGWVGAEEKLRLLERAACLVLPSYHEGLPLVVLEAMAAQVPVVATAVGGIPEVARDGVEALLVAPRDVGGLADAIARVLDDGDLVASLVGAARTRVVDEYGTEQLAARIGAVYEQVLGAR